MPPGQSYYSLAMGHTRVWFCFRCYYQAVTNQLCYEQDQDIRQTSCPKATGTKIPTGSTRRAEGEFSTLSEDRRIGPRSVLPRAPAVA